MSFHTRFPSNLKANTRGRCRSLRPRVVIYGTSDRFRQPPERVTAERADSLTGLEDKMPHVQPHHHTSIHISSCYGQGFTRASPGSLAVPERFRSWLGPTATPEGLWGRPYDLYHIFMALWLPSWIGSIPPRTDQRRQFLFSHRHHSGTTSPFHTHHEGFFIFWTVQREIKFQIPTGILRYSNIFNTWRLSQGNLDFTRSGFPWKHTAHNAVTGKCSEMHVPASKYMNHKMQLISTSI